MDKKELEKEREYLNDTKQVIDNLLFNKNDEIKKEDFAINNLQKYFNDNKIDEQEQAYILTELYRRNSYAEAVQKYSRQLKKIRKNPFFGKIVIDDKYGKNEKFYIGLKNIQKDDKLYVLDWRAPISSIYYNANLGTTNFESPEGTEKLNLSLKRQFKIENEQLEYYVDTDTKVDDDVLQKILSENTSEHLKNIVRSIQIEQNKIIRESSSSNIILLGKAGSGKTSIAMHRIAYLLYLNKGDITSDQFMVISPNNLFSRYVSGLLPELGEEDVPVSSFRGLIASRVSTSKLSKPREEMLERCLKNNKLLNSVKQKFTYEYFLKLCAFISEYNKPETFKGFTIEKKNITEEIIKENYFIGKEKWNINDSLKITIDRIIDLLYSNYTETKQNIISDKIFEAFQSQLNINLMFSKFMQKEISSSQIDYEDFSTLAFLEMSIKGFKESSQTKYVFIDEVQDYDAISLNILKHIFPRAITTIVGDFNQNLLFKDENLPQIEKIFDNSITYTLEKSYRSTTNITNFASKILEEDTKVIDIRKGETPLVLKAETIRDNIQNIKEKLLEYLNKGYGKIAVICKTKSEAEYLSKIFKNMPKILSEIDTKNFLNKAIITTAYLSKGLEFDAVIIPDISSLHYKTNQDRQFLYVAVTRALHELSLFHVGEKSKFIK